LPVDGTIFREKAKMIAARLNIENFTAPSGWITRFKDQHGLVCKNVARESAAMDSESTEAWLERLPFLLEGYEQCEIYNADETGLFYNVLPDRTLALKGESSHGRKNYEDRLTDLLCVNSNGSDKQVPIVIRKSPKLRCFKNIKITRQIPREQ
jgi:hypothetical protein